MANEYVRNPRTGSESKLFSGDVTFSGDVDIHGALTRYGVPIGEASEEEAAESVIYKSPPIDLTDAQIKALPGGEEGEGFLSLVAAPGANKVYRILELCLISNFVSVYANVSATAKLIGAVGASVGAGVEEQTLAARNIAGVNSSVTTFFTVATRQVLALPAKFIVDLISVGAYVPNLTATVLSTMVNQPIGLYCLNPAGNFTGGHVDNTLRAIVTYMIDDV